LQAWELRGAQRRQAAISSFGFSGTNAHLVLGEYLPSSEVRPQVTAVTQNKKVIVPLSARTAEQVRQRAGDLLDFIRREPSVDLIEMAYTLQVGREPMEERAGFLVSSVEQLSAKLEAWVNGEPEIKDFYQGQCRRGKESISIISQDDEVKETLVEKWIAARKLSKLLDVWVRGLDLNWNKLYGEVKPHRIALPTYPFAKERYWIDTTADSPAGGLQLSGSAAVLHPLLHSNTSDLSEQRYSSTFTGGEFFPGGPPGAHDAGVMHKVMPGVACLEMARAAIGQAVPARSGSMVLELRNTVWVQPLVVTRNKRVSLALLTNDDDQNRL